MQKDKNLRCCLVSRSMRPNGKYEFGKKSTARLASPARFQYAAQEDDERCGKRDIEIDRRQKGEGGGGNASRALSGDRQSHEARRRQGEYRRANEVARFQACRRTFEIAVCLVPPPGIEPGSATPQAAILSIKLREGTIREYTM